MMRRLGVGSLLLLFFIGYLPGQVLPSVDIATAQTHIDQFTRENELLAERIALLLTTNQELTDDIVLWGTWKSGIEIVTERLVSRATELIDLLDEMASKSIVERAQSVLDRYYTLKAILDAKHQELVERSGAAKVSIEKNTTVVAELRQKISNNLENIELLRAAVERSKGSEETVNLYIENLEKAIEDAEKALILPLQNAGD